MKTDDNKWTLRILQESAQADDKYTRDHRLMDRLLIVAVVFALAGLVGIIGCFILILR